MAANNSWRRRVFFAMLAATLLVAGMTLPGLAAPSKTMTFLVNSIGPTNANFTPPLVNTAPANSTASFWIRAINTTPGTGNPNSLQVTAPPGFVITNATVDNANSSKSNNIPTYVFDSSGKFVNVNNIQPLQNNQWITVRIDATTPGCPSGGPSDVWKGVLWQGGAVGNGLPFTTTISDGTTTALTSTSCPGAPGSVSISSTPAASGDIVNYLGGQNVTFTASPNPVAGTPTPTVYWQSSTASDCRTNASAAFADIASATGPSYSLTPAHTADNNKCFRAQARNTVNPPSTSNVLQLSLSTVTLEFVTAPHSAATDTKITGTDFDPAGDTVEVELKVDGVVSNAFDGTNNVAITDGATGSTHISGGTASMSGGHATFPVLQIDTAGEYSLTANVTGGPSTSSVAITLTPAGVCPDGVSGQEDFTTPEFGELGEGTLNISGLTSNECVGLDVAFSLEGGFQQWSIEVNKLSVEDKLTGYATWTWDLPGTDPVPWTQIKWKHSNGVSLEETNFVDLPRCNAEAVTDPMPNPTLPNPAYSALFPTVSTTLGDIPAGVCMFNSTLEASGGTYTEAQQIAINEDPAGRKG